MHRNGTSKSGTNRGLARTEKKSVSDPNARRDLQKLSKIVEAPQNQVTLSQLPIGARLLVRSHIDWRFAAVSKTTEETVVLTICSPTGRTYRLRRSFDAKIVFEGTIPILKPDTKDSWRDNFTKYDLRW